MAPRRRAVERVNRRESVVDRVVTVILVLLAASGVMSVLPGRSQQAISRRACQIGSFGLGSCGAVPPDLGTDALTAPRCALLAHLDATLPEVQVRRLTTDQGLPVQVSSTRAGDIYLRVGGEDAAPLPSVLAGESRSEREVLAGARVPQQAEWYLPGGQGADAVVDSIQDQHRRWSQRRSSLAVLDALGSGGRDLPPPTLLLSRVDLGTPVLPRPAAGRTPPVPARRGPAAPRSVVTLVRDVPARATFNRISRESSVTAALTGTAEGVALDGGVRWTRDGAGTVTSVVVGVASATPLVAGEPEPAAGSVEVTYVSVPVGSPAEREVVQAWLSDPAGFRLDLRDLLGLTEAPAADQLRSFLTRAATVTVLRYSTSEPPVAAAEVAARRVRDELGTARRVEWPGSRLLLAAEVAPQANGTPRVLVTDPTCGTP